MSLVVAPCAHDAAAYAVERWHYSQRMPRSRSALYGVWEDGRFIGAVVFGHGATQHLGRPYGLNIGQAVELTRVALRDHVAPVSQIVSLAVVQVRLTNPTSRLVVSFADPERGHHGGIYQAGNWIYTGTTQVSDEYIIKGQRYQGRALRSTRNTHPRGRAGNHSNVLDWARAYLDPHARQIPGSSKHRYVMPLDKAMRRRVAKLAQPYPHAVEESTVTRPDSVGEVRVQLPATAPTQKIAGVSDG